MYFDIYSIGFCLAAVGVYSTSVTYYVYLTPLGHTQDLIQRIPVLLPWSQGGGGLKLTTYVFKHQSCYKSGAILPLTHTS